MGLITLWKEYIPIEESYRIAAGLFSSIADYKDSRDKLAYCNACIEYAGSAREHNRSAKKKNGIIALVNWCLQWLFVIMSALFATVKESTGESDALFVAILFVLYFLIFGALSSINRVFPAVTLLTSHKYKRRIISGVFFVLSCIVCTLGLLWFLLSAYSFTEPDVWFALVFASWGMVNLLPLISLALMKRGKKVL